MSSNMKIIPVIMCGGAGTRLWPVSRNSMPKQFIPLLGERSTFQRVARTVTSHAAFDELIVVTSAEYRFTVLDQLQSVGASAQIVLEPMRRDSAAAVAVATELALQRNPGAIVAVLAADHVIQDESLFVETCLSAAAAAEDERIVTIGIPPTNPATGYGYISPGKVLPKHNNAKIIERFVEKPDAETAARYVLDGYLWNSGNFIFHAPTMRVEIERFEPEILTAASEAVALARRDLDFILLDEAAFGRAPKKSIDYAVMEHTARAAVVPGSFGWSDVGGWAAVWDLSEKDEAGNAISGRGYVLGGKGNYIRSEEGLTAVVGMDDVVVVSTRDAVLVVPKDRADGVKDMVATLQSAAENAAEEHLEMFRPWGKYISIDRGGRYQVKRITVKPGGILSLQKHFHRAEHWVVVKGTAEVTRDDETIMVHENESIYLPIGCVHRMANPGKIPLELIEVQVGSYLGEDDIVRIEDAYKRQ